MYLQEIIKRIERAACAEPAVNMLVRADVYKLNAEPSAAYGAFCWTQRQHSETTDGQQLWSFVLFFVDRLESDRSNETEVQSVGCAALSNIIRNVIADGSVDADSWQLDIFNQRFADECAGAYATVTFATDADDICEIEFDALTIKTI